MAMKIKSKKEPWPTKAVMEQIYALNLWGTNEGQFYSGDGSHHEDFVDPYIIEVSSFLRSFETPLVVCDLGCGDFNVGKELVKHTKQYIAVDIVSELIKHNQAMFKDEKLTFHCLDIATDELPSGDCVILRQVLQHLSNAENQAIANKLLDFRYVILTEHVPDGDFEANKDIVSGQGIRLKKQSGINLLAPPFNFEVKQTKRLLEVNLASGKGVHVTTLYVL